MKNRSEIIAAMLGVVAGVVHLSVLGAGTVDPNGHFQGLTLGGHTNVISDDNVGLTYNGAHYQRSVPILNNLTNGIGTNLTSLLAAAVQAGQTNDGTANWSASGTTNSTLAGSATIQGGHIGFPSTSMTVIGVGAATNKLSQGTNLVASDDVFLGYLAGQNVTNDQTFTTFVGSYAGSSMVEGVGATAVGQKAFISATTIGSSTAVGSKAGSTMAYPHLDTFVGFGAAQFANGGGALGGFRTYLGYNAGSYEDGDKNIMIGYNSGKQAAPNATGALNVFIGSTDVGKNHTSGTQDICIGDQAGTALTSGSSDVFIGYQAGKACSINYWNTFIGTGSGIVAAGGDGNTAIGNESANHLSTGYKNTILGHKAAETLTTGVYNTVLGDESDVSDSNASVRSVLGVGAIGTMDNSVTLGRNVDSVITPSGWLLGGRSTVLTSATPSSLFWVTCPTTNFVSGKVQWCVNCTDGNEAQSQNGDTYFTAVGKGTTVTAAVTSVTNSAALSGGTLTVSLTANTTTNNVLAIQATATTSLTTTNLLIKWRITTPSTYTVNPL